MKKLFLIAILGLPLSTVWGQSGTGNTPPKINFSESTLTACAGSDITLVAAAGCSFGASNSHTITLPYTKESLLWACIQVTDVDGQTDSVCFPITVLPAPETPTLTPSSDTVCVGTVITLTATADAITDAYSFNGGEWQSASATTVTVKSDTTFIVKARSVLGCESAAATATVAIYAAFTAGSITAASGATMAGVSPSATVTNATVASGGDDNITYEWRRSGTSSATLTGSAASYSIGNDAANYATVGTYYIKRYAHDSACNTSWVESDGQYTLTVAPFVPPSYAASAQTWTFGSSPLVWSDAIQIPECNKSDFTSSISSPRCRSYSTGENTWYYYNWTYVNTNKNTLCPSPWRVPTAAEFATLLNSMNADEITALQKGELWGYGGYCYPSLYWQATYGAYWSINGGTISSLLLYDSINSRVSSVYGDTGCQVRCVQ
jgi:hypothetical protein